MKCDELKAHYISTRSEDSCYFYFKDDVDAAIAELKQKLQDLWQSPLMERCSRTVPQ